MNKLLLLSGVASVASFSSSMAGDLPSKKPAPSAPAVSVPAHSWTGLSFGVGGGAQFLQSHDYVNSDAFAYADAEGFVSQQVDHTADMGRLGAFGTVQIAADYEASGMVFGGFADYDFGKVQAKWDEYNNSCYSYGPPFAAECRSGASVEISNSWDVGARLGFLVTDRALVYGLAGYSWGKIKTSAYNNAWNGTNNYSNTAAFNVGAVKSETRGGLMLGAGVEYALTNNLSLKAEYRHVDYGKMKVDENVYEGWDYLTAGYYSYGTTHESRITNDSVRALLSYKF